MKPLFYQRIPMLLILCIFSMTAFAQKGVVIGGTDLDPSAILEMKSDSQGMLVPRMTTLQRDANISSPANGLLIYNEDNGIFNKYYNGTWTELDQDWTKINSLSERVFTNSNVGVGESWNNIRFTIRGTQATVANFLVKDTNGGEQFRINSNGNTGIRQTWGDTDFNIRGISSNTYLFKVDGSDGDSKFIVRSNGAVGIGNSFQDTRLNIRPESGSGKSFVVENSTGDDKFIIRSDGLVGINLINNGTDLNIKGTTTNETHFRIVSPTSNNPVFVVNNVLNNPANHILDVKHPDGTEILRVTSTDNFVVANGNNALKPGGGPWIAFSDKRLKKDITSYDEGLDLIKKITPVRFKYNGKGKTPNGGSEHVGIIAQDLQKIAPHMIITQEKDRDDGVEYLAVNGNAFTYMLINAVQEQQEQIETLQNKYDELLQRLEALEKK